MTPPINYYTLLGLDERATDRQIRTAFRLAVLEHHPDRHNNADHAQEKTILLKQAYEVLSDPARRLQHDRTLRRQDQAQWLERRPLPPGPAARPRPPVRPRRVLSFHSLLLAAWAVVELCLFLADRVLPRLGDGDPPPNWLWDAFSCGYLSPTLATMEGDAAFVTNSIATAVGFLSFLLTSACFRLVGRSSHR